MPQVEGSADTYQCIHLRFGQAVCRSAGVLYFNDKIINAGAGYIFQLLQIFFDSAVYLLCRPVVEGGAGEADDSEFYLLLHYMLLGGSFHFYVLINRKR